jgi:hypothetical protein
MPTIIGLSLIKMYKTLGIEIYEPNLRAALERDLIRISKGEIKIDDIYQEIKEESLLLYSEIENNIQKLQNSLKNYLKNEKDKDKDSIFNIENDEDEEKEKNKKALTPEILLEKVDIDKEFENLEKDKKDLFEFKKDFNIKDKSLWNKENNKLKSENSLRRMLGAKLKGEDNENENDIDTENDNDNDNDIDDNKGDNKIGDENKNKIIEKKVVKKKNFFRNKL